MVIVIVLLHIISKMKDYRTASDHWSVPKILNTDLLTTSGQKLTKILAKGRNYQEQSQSVVRSFKNPFAWTNDPCSFGSSICPVYTTFVHWVLRRSGRSCDVIIQFLNFLAPRTCVVWTLRVPDSRE